MYINNLIIILIIVSVICLVTGLALVDVKKVPEPKNDKNRDSTDRTIRGVSVMGSNIGQPGSVQIRNLYLS